MSTSQFAKGLLAVNQIVEAHRREAEEKMDIDPFSADVLRFIHTTGPKRMKDIGEKLHIKLSNLTNIIDRLENAKLVRRTDSKEDRRAVVVEPTQKGLKVLDKYDQLLLAIASQIESKVSADMFAAAANCISQIGSIEIEHVEM